MPIDRDDSWRLQFIKSHVDFHGIGCAIVDDHVVIGLEGANADEPRGCIRRVRSYEEACQAIGCRCRDVE